MVDVFESVSIRVGQHLSRGHFFGGMPNSVAIQTAAVRHYTTQNPEKSVKSSAPICAGIIVFTV